MRRKYYATKQAIAIIAAASMVMSQGMVAMAETTDNKVIVDTSTTDIPDTAEAESASSSTVSEYGADPAVSATSTGGEASVKIDHDVTAETAEGAIGIEITSSGETSEAKVTVDVGGDVSSKSTSSDGSYYVTGVEINTSTENHDASTSVTIGGSIETSNGFNENLTTNTVATGSHSATTSVEVGSDISSSGATASVGIISTNYAKDAASSASTSINVHGDVNNTSSYALMEYGVAAISLGDGTSSTTIDVDGSITSSITHSMGSLSPEDEEELEQYERPAAILVAASNAGSSTNVSVGGDVTVKSVSNGVSRGIQAGGIAGEETFENIGTVDVSVGGSIIQDSTSGQGAYLADSTEATENTSIKLCVVKDITAKDTAIEIDKYY